jgi:hypothetical protein
VGAPTNLPAQCVFDNGAQIIPRLPKHAFLWTSIVRNHPVKIARPPGTKNTRNWSSCFLSDRVQYLEHRISTAVAAIEHMAQARPGQ